MDGTEAMMADAVATPGQGEARLTRAGRLVPSAAERRARAEASRLARIESREALRARLKETVRSLRVQVRRGAAPAAETEAAEPPSSVSAETEPDPAAEPSPPPGRDEGSLFAGMLNADVPAPEEMAEPDQPAEACAAPELAKLELAKLELAEPELAEPGPAEQPAEDTSEAEPDPIEDRSVFAAVLPPLAVEVGAGGGPVVPLEPTVAPVPDLAIAIGLDQAVAEAARSLARVAEAAASVLPDPEPSVSPDPPEPEAAHRDAEPQAAPRAARTVRAAVEGSIELVPILGPGMRLRLAQLGYASEADLADADPQRLKAELGPISRLLDVEGWIARARNSSRHG